MISALVGIALVFITVCGQVFLYGKLVGKVAQHTDQLAGHEMRFEKLDVKFERHDDLLNHHGARISVVESKLGIAETRF